MLALTDLRGDHSNTLHIHIFIARVRACMCMYGCACSPAIIYHSGRWVRVYTHVWVFARAHVRVAHNFHSYLRMNRHVTCIVTLVNKVYLCDGCTRYWKIYSNKIFSFLKRAPMPNMLTIFTGRSTMSDNRHNTA